MAPLTAEELAKVIAEIRHRSARTEKGRWKLWGGTVMADPKGTSNVDDAIEVARCPLQPNEHGGSHVANAYYIQAAQPANVLAICAELDRVTAERDEARDAALAFRELNAAFRLGRPPSQKLCERLAVAGDAVRTWPKPERKP